MSSNTEISQPLIRVLPPEICNKIAAGEVVERPSSVVKELLDNALDAGASSIRVIIKGAGKTLIQVIDNGSGMSTDDVPLVFLRHATSKIEKIDDLFNIRTLGFRGEAMASIASISQVTLRTKRREDATGHEFEVWGGEEKELKPAAIEDGTSIAVRNLFYNVPARRAFIKTDATELRHIIITFQQAAISNPDVAFELISDNSVIYKLPVRNLDERIAEIFGKPYKASLIRVQEETSILTLTGYIIDPRMVKKTRGEQFLFVNGRPFMHRHINYVIQNVYNTWIRPDEYPFYALFYKTDPGNIDVNVHPSKLEVKFEDERAVSTLTRSIVKRALNDRYNVPRMDHLESAGATEAGSGAFSRGFDFSRDQISAGRPFGRPSAGPARGFAHQADITDRIYGDSDRREFHSGNESLHANPAEEGGKQPGFDKFRGFWQLHDQYVISQTLSGLCIVDQHTAHKRIIFEKAMNASQSGLPSTQQLLFPQSIDFSASDFTLLKELHPAFQKMGFNIQLLSGNSAIVSGVPADIKMGNEKHVIESILQQYQNFSSSVRMGNTEKLALALANKTAIPRGKRLSEAEMEILIDQLFACEQPYFDPLNKPAIIYIPLEEIKDRFR
ncbi:MAG: DNA mismatch repair endonuclease MutL [Cyclonatronaceae bacterium]